MTRWILRTTAIASAFLPLVAVKGLYHPFETPRHMLWSVLAAVAAPAALAVWLRMRGTGRPGAVAWSAMALVAVLGLTTIVSVSPANSFWGSPERLIGLVTVIQTALLAASLWVFFRTDAPGSRIFAWSWFLTAAAVAAWAVFERLIPGFWAQFNGNNLRSVATWGNPIYLAQGLLLLVPGCLAVAAILPRADRRRWALGALAALCTAGVLATESRGALLALLAGGAAGALLLAWWSRRPVVRAAGLAVPLVAALLLLGVFLLRDQPWLTQMPIAGRALNVFTAADASRMQRVQLWQVAIDALRDRPLTGWGLENFDTALDRLYLPAFTSLTVKYSYSDRAHNAFLDVAIAGGVFALAAYVAFLASLAARAVALKKSGALPPPAAAAAFGAVAAFAAFGATAFDTQATLLTLAVGAAWLTSRVPAVVPRGSLSQGQRAAVGAVALVLAAVTVAGIVPLARGAAILHAAVTEQTPDAYRKAAARIGTFWNPYRPTQEHRVANEIFKAAGNDADWDPVHVELVSASRALLEDAIARRPENFSFRFTFANLLLLEALHGLRPYDDAVAALEAARLLAPRRQIVDYQLGNLHLAAGQPAEAVAAFARAVALDPTVYESRWHYARGLATAGETARAAAEFRAAWEAGFRGDRPEDEWALALRTLASVPELGIMEEIYRYRLDIESNNANLLASLATVAAERGDQAGAIAALRRAIELDPTLRQEVPAFLLKYGYPEDVLNDL